MPPFLEYIQTLLANPPFLALVVFALLVGQGGDLATGWLAAYITRTLSSKVSMRGVAKKAIVLTSLVVIASFLPLLSGLPLPPDLIFAAIAMGFIGTDLISIRENLAKAGVINPAFSHFADEVGEVLRRGAPPSPPSPPTPFTHSVLMPDGEDWATIIANAVARAERPAAHPDNAPSQAFDTAATIISASVLHAPKGKVAEQAASIDKPQDA